MFIFLFSCRGMPNVIGNKQHPATIGACPLCDIKGVRVGNTTVYPGAVTFTPMDSSVRSDFEAHFMNIPAIKKLAYTETEDRSTTSMHANFLEDAELQDSERRWKFLSPFCTVLDDFDIIDRCVPDPAHALSHFISDMYSVLSDQMVSKKRSRKSGTSTHGEHPEKHDLDGQRPQYNHRYTHGSQTIIKEIDQLFDISADQPLLVPESWELPYAVFNTTKSGRSVRIAEKLAHFSDVGRYTVGLVNADVTVKTAFIKSLQVFEKLLAKKSRSDEEMMELRKQVAACLGQLEILLTLRWCTISKHLLVHLPKKFLRHGAYWSVNMMTEERFHKSIRTLTAQCSSNVTASLGKNYEMFQKAHLEWGLDSSTAIKSHLNRPDIQFSDQK